MCHFGVLRFIDQRSPLTSEKRRLKMVGHGKTIPDKDQGIGLEARKYLSANPCHLVVLIDDLEYGRREQAQQIFARYRQALDTMLIAPERKRRASVHFLVNMLEAYYFADARAVNEALALNPPLEDYQGDVETIPHPKNELKKIYHGFREVTDGEKILERLNVEHVLSRPDSCAWLRTLFAWCLKVLSQHPNYEGLPLANLADQCRLRDGILSDVTRSQLDNLEEEDTHDL